MTESRPAPTGASGQTTLKRAIGPKLLLLFVVGDILGTGIYALTGKVAGEVGGAAWTAFALSFGVALLTATSYVELVGKYPQAAGAALYTHKAFAIHFLTFIVAFTVMCSGLTSASSAANAFKGFVETLLAEYTSWVPGGVGGVIIALVFLIVLSLINFRGVSESVKLNVVLTIIELSGLLLIIGIGAVALIRGLGDPSIAFDFKTGANPFVTVTTGAALAFFALVGFEDSVNMAEETKNPQRSFPRALFVGLSIAGGIYILVAFVSTTLVDLETLQNSDNALFEVINVGWKGFPLAVFTAISAFAVTNSALINMLMASRLIYGMSRQNVIPRFFSKVHPSRRTPWAAIIFTSVLAIVLISTADVADLGGTTSLLLMLVFFVVNIAVLVLRRDPVQHDHYRAPTIAPIIAAVACLYLASPFARIPAAESDDPWMQYKIAGLLFVLGVVLWAVTYLAHGRHAATIDPATLDEAPDEEDTPHRH